MTDFFPVPRETLNLSSPYSAAVLYGMLLNYDRLLEMCVPVYFDVASLRREKTARNLEFFRQLTETVAS